MIKIIAKFTVKLIEFMHHDCWNNLPFKQKDNYEVLFSTSQTAIWLLFNFSFKKKNKKFKKLRHFETTLHFMTVVFYDSYPTKQILLSQTFKTYKVC